MAKNIVSQLLADGFNYPNWSVCMKNYLMANDLWDIVEATTEAPNPEEAEAEFKAWRKKNAAALHAIQISCMPHILFQIKEISSARICWDTLAKMHEVKSPGDQILPQEAELPPVEVLLQLPAAGNPGTERDAYVEFLPLHNAIEIGDLNDVREFLRRRPDAVCKKLIDNGFTALHLATSTGKLKMVEELVKLLTEEELKVTDNLGGTALLLAAATGATRIAECLIEKNRELVIIPGNEHNLPVIMACTYRHKDMARYLYSITPFELLRPENGVYGSLLLYASIFSKMFGNSLTSLVISKLEKQGFYLFILTDFVCFFLIMLQIQDISLDLLQKCPPLATTLTSIPQILATEFGQGITPLIQLSGQSDLFPSSVRFVFWKRWIYSCIQVQLPAAQHTDVRISIPQDGHAHPESILVRGLGLLRRFGSNLLQLFGIKQIYDTKLTHAYALELLHWMCKHISTIDNTKLQQSGVYEAFFEAIKFGTIEVVIEMLKANPSLLTVSNFNCRGILQYAVEHRQEKIFSLIYALETKKHLLISLTDYNRNNILHIAAKLAPPDRLASISGAALQMQRELQWYKEVESIVDPSFQENVNMLLEKPKDIFSNQHKQLVSDGEKWMKETATSCTVVGALIITIMFTAAFTVPGGNFQDTGFPIFLHRKSFMTFIISDAISLFASSTSVLMFLGILTSRYAEDDFLKSLPTKLIIGLSTLFISIAAMMVAFCATLIIMFQGELKLVIPITLLAGIPVTLFILLQFPLLVEILVSTYGPGIFDKNMKYWY
ncbi:uncharacterized protein LOC110633868 isoform X2 [Hevea brasiliensis]|uniref:uncharacterized protein LOC110633868 isoform X2 n=1 Tax=Hevea brasiliensis TaxID=3981 RepID=UPI0025D07BF0|nr:uncharacterized protein LOC110633868 isoform X2 [Hevea brasiliensis]